MTAKKVLTWELRSSIYHGEDHILILTVKYDCQKSDLEIMILSENETNSKTC